MLYLSSVVDGQPVTGEPFLLGEFMNNIQLTEMKDILQRNNDFIEMLSKTIEEMQPDYDFAQIIKQDGRLYSFKDTSDILKDKTGLGRNRLFEWLRDRDILCGTTSNWNKPYATYIDRGYFKTKVKPTNIGVKTVPFFTAKGIDWIIKLWSKENGIR